MCNLKGRKACAHAFRFCGGKLIRNSALNYNFRLRGSQFRYLNDTAVLTIRKELAQKHFTPDLYL